MGCEILPTSQLWPDVERVPRTSLAQIDRLTAWGFVFNSYGSWDRRKL